jgi:hypothetical protein
MAGRGQLFEYRERTERPRFIAGMPGGIEMCDVAHEPETERLVSNYGYFTRPFPGCATIFGMGGCVFIVRECASKRLA